jgi:hypothetical protein
LHHHIAEDKLKSTILQVVISHCDDGTILQVETAPCPRNAGSSESSYADMLENMEAGFKTCLPWHQWFPNHPVHTL